MFNSGLMEKVKGEQRRDWMKEAETNRLLRNGRRGRPLKLNIMIIGSGLTLIGLLVIQLL